jgi:ubiquitin-conjugating enzyme E2 J2
MSSLPVISGPPDSPYSGGLYHGKLLFPREYPFKPPAIFMCTPSGRFKPDTRLCLSMSDFHPETWNPLWSVSSILAGLLSFMLETTPTQGSVETSDATKREFARRSREYNKANPVFRKLFPHYCGAAAEEAETDASAVATPTAANNAPADAAAVRRRGPEATAAAAAPAASASATAAPAAHTAATGPAALAAAAGPALAPRAPGVALSLLGGRVQVRQDQLYDYAAAALIVCGLGCAFVYGVVGKRQ